MCLRLFWFARLCSLEARRNVSRTADYFHVQILPWIKKDCRKLAPAGCQLWASSSFLSTTSGITLDPFSHRSLFRKPRRCPATSSLTEPRWPARVSSGLRCSRHYSTRVNVATRWRASKLKKTRRRSFPVFAKHLWHRFASFYRFRFGALGVQNRIVAQKNASAYANPKGSSPGFEYSLEGIRRCPNVLNLRREPVRLLRRSAPTKLGVQLIRRKIECLPNLALPGWLNLP
ncbi:hypothetical protein B0H12DRAFT_177029 [Mycena haematopus]|nr:hypothetical protein B0H12DRAFT_177029 [Mycena haematopus]